MGRAAFLALLVAVYYAAGRFGLSLALVHESASAVWPPAGIAIAACLLAGPRVWPAIMAGAFLVNLGTSGTVLPSLLIACGNTAEALLAAWLTGRLAGGAAALERTTGILAYVASAAAASAVAASIGLAALVPGAGAPFPLAMTWVTWWTGDLAGALLVAPPIVVWARLRRPNPWPWDRWFEAAAVAVLVVLAAYVIFGPSVAGVRSYPLMFVALPGLLWTALRFGRRGATLAMAVTAAIATAGTLEGFGPFARTSPNESLLLLQAYLGVKMVVFLCLAAEVAARRGAERDLRVLNADLARRVEARAEELRRLHGRLVEAQEVAHIGSWEWDIESDTIWWSDEMYRVAGLSPGSPVTFERYVSLIHPDDRTLVEGTVRRSIETGQPFAFEHRLITPDGSERVLYARGRPVADDQGRPVRMLGVGHDITDVKRAEIERLALVREQAARLEAEEANRMKDYFLATLSHELRTPLNAIVGWAQMLRKHTLDDEMRTRAIEAIHRNALVQAELVSDILDVARIRSGTLSIEPRPVRVSAIVEAAVDVIRPVIDAKRIHLAVNVPDDLNVEGDAQRLQQVLRNVLTNATRFVPDGGHIGVTAGPDGDAVRIAVEDDGPGIAEAFLPFVFDQFRQADPSPTREHGGLGLGLAISQQLVQLHGGTIRAANRDGGGAVFTVRLPTAPVAVDRQG